MARTPGHNRALSVIIRAIRAVVEVHEEPDPVLFGLYLDTDMRALQAPPRRSSSDLANFSPAARRCETLHRCTAVQTGASVRAPPGTDAASLRGTIYMLAVRVHRDHVAGPGFRVLRVDDVLNCSTQPVLARPHENPIVILPGFGNNQNDYQNPFGVREDSLVSQLQVPTYNCSNLSVSSSLLLLSKSTSPWFRVGVSKPGQSLCAVRIG